mmetsp:Transcript_111101/g.315200  ORF Transcript_111101/g.315200 Transcript_111101/m.315200 type:complete len:542 (+) Transcript_111101:24-1649(+)
MNALVVVNCFPPLLKNAGGVSKRYLTLCRALIDGLGWKVTLVTPVDIRRSGEADVSRWLEDGSMIHLPARGVRIESTHDGVAVFNDILSFVNIGLLLQELCWKRDCDCVWMDDLPWRFEPLLLVRAMAIPSVISTHTDITHMPSCKGVVKLVWYLHVYAAHLASVHATVSKVFGRQMSSAYRVPVGAVWPPILWSLEFKSEPAEWTERAAATRRSWLSALEQRGCRPRAIMFFAGRWSAEKRIHLLVDAVPEDCALVICGDGTSEYATKIGQSGPESGRPNVLALRKMLNAVELRQSYTACDLFISASNFETLGNTVIEAFCSGTPVAVQPAQGHLEYVKDGVNSWFVDYEDAKEARATLTRIVAGGLDAASLPRVLPELAPLGQRLRTIEFARELDVALVQPALEAGRAMSLGRGACADLLEVATRAACLTACWIIWWALRVFSRVTYVTSSDPKFQILGELGRAMDDGKGRTTYTFPCLRLLFDSGACQKRSVSMEPADDYDSHFRDAQERALSKWWKDTHEVVLCVVLLVVVWKVATG